MEPHHLFDALDAAAREDNALNYDNGMTIDTYFRSWSEKAGHPLLTVTVNQTTGLMSVVQVIFCLYLCLIKFMAFFSFFKNIVNIDN